MKNECDEFVASLDVVFCYRRFFFFCDTLDVKDGLRTLFLYFFSFGQYIQIHNFHNLFHIFRIPDVECSFNLSLGLAYFIFNLFVVVEDTLCCLVTFPCQCSSERVIFRITKTNRKSILSQSNLSPRKKCLNLVWIQTFDNESGE